MQSKIQYISNGQSPAQHLDHIKAALDSGILWVQLRMKRFSKQDVYVTGQTVAGLCADYQATFILNDFVDQVQDVGADGVHLGLNDCTVEKARAALGEQAIIGGTANRFDDITRCMYAGCDYIGLGPYRYTRTKENLSPVLGLSGYQQIFKQLSSAAFPPGAIREKNCPVFAIGAVQPEDIPGLIAAGVYGVAMSGYLTKSPCGKNSLGLKRKTDQLKKLLYV